MQEFKLQKTNQQSFQEKKETVHKGGSQTKCCCASCDVNVDVDAGSAPSA